MKKTWLPLLVFCLLLTAPCARAEPALFPSFSDFTGWTPSEAGVFATLEDGSSYLYEAYYGFDETLAREYAALLRDGGYGLEAASFCLLTAKDGQTAIESTFVYTGAEDVGAPQFPDNVSGVNCHLYLMADTTQNVGMLLVYPQTMTPFDAGVRASCYGKAQGERVVPQTAPGETQACALCGGSGVCYRCQGSGVTYTLRGKITCTGCDGSGVCRWCRGRGY